MSKFKLDLPTVAIGAAIIYAITRSKTGINGAQRVFILDNNNNIVEEDAVGIFKRPKSLPKGISPVYQRIAALPPNNFIVEEDAVGIFKKPRVGPRAITPDLRQGLLITYDNIPNYLY